MGISSAGIVTVRPVLSASSLGESGFFLFVLGEERIICRIIVTATEASLFRVRRSVRRCFSLWNLLCCWFCGCSVLRRLDLYPRRWALATCVGGLLSRIVMAGFCGGMFRGVLYHPSLLGFMREILFAHFFVLSIGSVCHVDAIATQPD